MNIEEFCEKYQNGKKEIKSIMCQWELDSLLHTQVSSGVILADLLIGDGLLDQISPELQDAFTKLMGENAESYSQIKQILYEKLENGDASVLGLVNKIKGQVGENQFIEELGNDVTARLADSSNQEAWDVAIDHDGWTQYVQVKMHSDADSVVHHIKEIQNKLENGPTIYDGEKIVQKIDFAIPEDIREEVVQKIPGLGVDILPIQMSAADAANVVMDGVNNIDQGALENSFGELLGIAAVAGAMHALITASLIYKGGKQREGALSDIAKNTTTTAGGAIAGLCTEVLLQKIAITTGPTGVIVFATSMGTRAVLKRLIERTDYVTYLENENKELEKLIDSFNGANQIPIH